MNVYLIPSGLRDRAFWTCLCESVRFLFVGSDGKRSLRKKGGYSRRTARSHFGCRWLHKETCGSTQPNDTRSSRTSREVNRGWRWDFWEHLLWTQICHFCVTTLLFWELLFWTQICHFCVTTLLFWELLFWTQICHFCVTTLLFWEHLFWTQICHFCVTTLLFWEHLFWTQICHFCVTTLLFRNWIKIKLTVNNFYFLLPFKMLFIICRFKRPSSVIVQNWTHIHSFKLFFCLQSLLNFPTEWLCIWVMTP